VWKAASDACLHVNASEGVPLAWLPRLDDALKATTFPELRFLLSGRRLDSTSHQSSPDMPELLRRYADMHRAMVNGSEPLRAWIIHNARSGVGDRIKGWRAVFYTALMSGRAVFFSSTDVGMVSDMFLPGEVDWRIPPALEGQLASLQEYTPLGWDPLGTGIEDLAQQGKLMEMAFTDTVGFLVFTNRTPNQRLRKLAERYACRALPPGAHRLSLGVRTGVVDGVDVSNLAGTAMCVSRDVVAAVFFEDVPLSARDMLDFMFRPLPSYLASRFIPMLRRLPAWTSPGPRVGIHVRTFFVDDFADIHAQQRSGKWAATMLGPCMGCIATSVGMMAAAVTAVNASVYLVSDHESALMLRDFVPSMPLSSALLLKDDPALSNPIHVESTEDSAMKQIAFAEIIALSAVDVLVFARSGFSAAAAQWSSLPLHNQYFVDVRVASQLDSPLTTCPATLYFPRDLEW
jgi:hypothetical protein